MYSVVSLFVKPGEPDFKFILHLLVLSSSDPASVRCGDILREARIFVHSWTLILPPYRSFQVWNAWNS